MPLLSLWSSNPVAINEFTIEQIVAAAGTGELRDGSTCAHELREYLSQVASEKLAEYVNRCLEAHFPKSGNVLQDLINELGRRLDYKVTNGRYQGTVNTIGFDGIWISPEGQTIIVEVKTTDAYRISLDTIAGYRDKLARASQISPPSSSLLIVGREDTGELEAQVRGSRHAWDMRLISADALIKLVLLKESVEGSETGQKIRSLLIPREYTRLDEMIDVMFTAAKDVESASEIADASEQSTDQAEGTVENAETSPGTADMALEAKRDAIIAALSHRTGAPLIKKSRAQYWSATHDNRAVIIISSRTGKKEIPYWYGYRGRHDEFLREGKAGYLVLGCIDRDHAFCIPVHVIQQFLRQFYVTRKNDGTFYWHIQLAESSSGEVSLVVPKQGNISLSSYLLEIGGSATGTPGPRRH